MCFKFAKEPYNKLLVKFKSNYLTSFSIFQCRNLPKTSEFFKYKIKLTLLF